VGQKIRSERRGKKGFRGGKGSCPWAWAGFLWKRIAIRKKKNKPYRGNRRCKGIQKDKMSEEAGRTGKKRDSVGGEFVAPLTNIRKLGEDLLVRKILEKYRGLEMDS